MKRNLLQAVSKRMAGIMLCLAVTGVMADGFKPVALRYAEAALKQEMLSGKMMTLPEFEIFDSGDRRIYY